MTCIMALALLLGTGVKDGSAGNDFLSPAFWSCQKDAVTQLALNRCASDELARAESELDEVYRKVLEEARFRPGAAKKVRIAQRRWIQFRDSYLDALFPAKAKQSEYGTQFPMQNDLYRTTLTRLHVSALREMLAEYTPK